MKILTIVGARPQFIKASPVCKALRMAGHHEFLVHTGQHYDQNMSQVFFDEMQIPWPDVNLEIGSASHGRQTGQMLADIEELIIREKPDRVLVYGDTNSTLAGALAACKLHVPLAHVESGLRSFNREMPEEHNRVLTDHCADILFCPTTTAVQNLHNEGIHEGVHRVGDTMYDAVLQFSATAAVRSQIHEALSITRGQYILATVHRPYNTDNLETLRSILSAFEALDTTVVFPVHPRTRKMIGDAGVNYSSRLKLIEPVGYLDMIALERDASCILTDSGGVQKEAFFFSVPCVTLRPETEWVETVTSGWNRVVGTDRNKIVEAVMKNSWPISPTPAIFGDGNAAAMITKILTSH